MQIVLSKLRIARGCQERANHQNRGDAGDEKGFKQTTQLEKSDKRDPVVLSRLLLNIRMSWL
jgi:hypothetical protein